MHFFWDTLKTLCKENIGQTERVAFSKRLATLHQPRPNSLYIYLVQQETQCFYLQFLGLKLLISRIVLIQWFCLPIKTLIA